MSSVKGKWIVITVILFSLFSGGQGLGGLIAPTSYQGSQTTQQTGSKASDEEAVFVSKVLASTEEY